MQQLMNKLLDASPRKVLRKLQHPSGPAVVSRSNGRGNTAGRAVEAATNRRFEGGQLKGFLPGFFVERDRHIAEILREVSDTGELRAEMLLAEELSKFDERVVEYPIALEYLLKAAAAGPIDILDVGCVLNNALMREYVADAGRMIWFMNPSMEPSQYEKNVAFMLADMRNHQLPESLKFPLVTSFSTLEHIGMDNTRYGGDPKEFVDPPEHPESFAIEGTRSIAGLVAPGGTLLISVPYGVFEYVYTYGNLDDQIYYSFNAEMLLALERSLPEFEVSHSIYKVVPNRGWIETDIEDRDFLKYADNCAAAGAIAFIEAKRVGPDV